MQSEPPFPPGVACRVGQQVLRGSKHPLDQGRAARPTPAARPGTVQESAVPSVFSAQFPGTPPEGGGRRGPPGLRPDAPAGPLGGGCCTSVQPRPAGAAGTIRGTQFPSSFLLQPESSGEICILLQDTELCPTF